MKSFLLFGVLFTLSLSLVQCGPQKHQVICRYEGDFDTKCNPDGSGYTEQRCNMIDRVKKIKIWQVDKITRCDKPKSGCRCFENHDYEQECECINPRKRPKWPAVGVLRWNGTAYFDDNWWVGHNNPRKAYLPGEIHINGNGTYMKIWSRVSSWPKTGPAVLKFDFEIIIPSDDGHSYTKFQGNSSSKNCSKTYDVEPKSFSSMWTKPRYVQKFTLQNEFKKTRNIYSQVWSTVYIGDDWKRFWEWKMDYNTEKDYAIPTRFFFKVEDGFDGKYEHEKYNYSFEEIREDDETFRVEDYCHNA